MVFERIQDHISIYAMLSHLIQPHRKYIQESSTEPWNKINHAHYKVARGMDNSIKFMMMCSHCYIQSVYTVVANDLPISWFPYDPPGLHIPATMRMVIQNSLLVAGQHSADVQVPPSPPPPPHLFLDTLQVIRPAFSCTIKTINHM